MSDYEMQVYNTAAGFVWLLGIALLGVGHRVGNDLAMTLGGIGIGLLFLVDALRPLNDEPA